MEAVVIGLPKCGTSSLQRYLKIKLDIPKGVGKIESIFDTNARFLYDQFYKGAEPYVITRDQAERLWSGFYYFGYYKRMSFEAFLDNPDATRHNLGFNHPMEMCNWTPYLEPFNDLHVHIVRLDAILKDQGAQFPHVKDQSESKPEYKPIPDVLRQKVYKRLDKMRLDKYGVPLP